MSEIISKAIWIVFFLFVINANSQSNIDRLKFEKNTIYIFSRGTKTKSGIIAEKFNNKDKKITHVGIGFLENKELKIYNVVDVDTVQTALIINNLKEFLNDTVYYLSIWKCNTNYIDFLNLKKICKTYITQKIYFDFSFNLNNGNRMYCSEFCSTVLKETNPVKFNFRPEVMKLDSFYKTVLERDELVYFPVDFFEDNSNFKKIFETSFDINTN